MTNPTPHGQVPEALIDLIDAYAESRHRCGGGIYNAMTEAARKAVIEALSDVQALSAAPAGWNLVPAEVTSEMWEAFKRPNGKAGDYPFDERYAALLAASPTPPAEQQATKETSGGFHVWRDISTAPKDGSRFVATGHNYGLYSEVRHTCVAQWFRGCWMEASDWNETSELKYLTHWMPLPSPPDDVAAPAEQQAAPKAAPGEPFDECFPGEPRVAVPQGLISAACFAIRNKRGDGKVLEQLRRYSVGDLSQPLAPQQEAQEPTEIPEEIERMATDRYKVVPSHESMFHRWAVVAGTGTQQLYLGREVECQNMARKFAGAFLDGAFVAMQRTAPQPAPAPLSEMPHEKRKAIQEGEQIGASDAWFHARHNMLDTLDRRNVFRAGFDRGWNAALAAQGGKV